MRTAVCAALCLAAAASLAACGADVSDKARRQSERYYEAAYIAWFEEHDNLEAIRHLTRAVETNPDNDMAHYLLGTVRLGRGELDRAEKHLRAAVRLRREGRPAALAEAQNSLGVLLIHRGEVAEAVEHLEAAANEVLNREPWLALGNLGWAYIELAEYDRAIEALRRALFDQPRFCVGVFRLGQAQYLKGDYAQAAETLKRAVEIPEAGCDRLQDAFHFLGMAHLRLDRVSEAGEAFDRCVEINPATEQGVACAEAREGI